MRLVSELMIIDGFIQEARSQMEGCSIDVGTTGLAGTHVLYGIIKGPGGPLYSSHCSLACGSGV